MLFEIHHLHDEVIIKSSSRLFFNSLNYFWLGNLSILHAHGKKHNELTRKINLHGGQASQEED